MSDFTDWLRTGSADQRDRVAEGDREGFRQWLRHKTPADQQDDALSERLRLHIQQVNQAAADTLERWLHPGKRPTTQE